MFESFNLNKKDKYCLLIITAFSAILVGYYVNFNINIGVSCSDVYLYLLNALYFSGTNIVDTRYFYISPVICFLTSILFRLGLVDKMAIFIVTGLFAIMGNIGLYILLRRYFDETISVAGTVMCATFSLNLTWLANGSLDVPGLYMTIWIMLLSIIAIDENPKYYIYASAMIVLGTFTRYTILLTLPAILLYYLYVNGFKIGPQDWKYLKMAAAVGLIMTAIILAVTLLMGHNSFGLTRQISGGVMGSKGHLTDPSYNTQVGYYLINLPNFISNSYTYFDGNPVLANPTILSWALLGILAIGTILWIADNKPTFKKENILPISLFIIAVATYTHISSFITIIIVLIGLYLLGKDSPHKTGYMMMAWILGSLIFLSYHDVKVNRYIVPIFPPLVYFILIAIDKIHDKIKINKNIIPIALIILFAIQGFAFTQTFELTDQYSSHEDMTNYIIENVPDYKNITIGVYNIRPFSWWLGSNISGITDGDIEQIDKSNLTYYIAHKKIDNLTNYTSIKNIGDLYLYKRSV